MEKLLFWPETVLSYYTYAVSELRKSDTRVYEYSIFLDKNYFIIKDFLLSGKSNVILIKTSVTGKRKPNHEINYNILNKVIDTVRKVCPKSKIILADGPAYSNSYFSECCKLKWDFIANKYDVDISDMNKDDYILLFNTWPISKLWLESDKIINLCKAKTHRRFGVTLSLKNMLGAFSGEILGYPKFSYKHEFVPRLLYEVDQVSPKKLNIIDGYQGIEGNGPMRGRTTKSNFIVTGTDSYSCDFQSTIEMGFAPAATLATIRPFTNNGLTDIDLDKNDIIKLRRSSLDFFPSIKCAWMYNSLNLDFNKLENYYQVLMEGIKQCWEMKI